MTQASPLGAIWPLLATPPARQQTTPTAISESVKGIFGDNARALRLEGTGIACWRRGASEKSPSVGPYSATIWMRTARQSG
jgi:hypothetical protein